MFGIDAKESCFIGFYNINHIKVLFYFGIPVFSLIFIKIKVNDIVCINITIGSKHKVRLY